MKLSLVFRGIRLNLNEIYGKIFKRGVRVPLNIRNHFLRFRVRWRNFHDALPSEKLSLKLRSDTIQTHYRDRILSSRNHFTSMVSFEALDYIFKGEK